MIFPPDNNRSVMPTVVGAGLAVLTIILFFLLTSGSAEAQEPPANNLATGAPTISGTPQVRETLAADVAGISDADGLTNPVFTYQWIRNDGTFDSNIQGATSSTYTLDVYDQGKAIKVKVSFTDDRSHEETLTSLATVAVAATTPGAPLKVKVSPYGSGVLCVSWRPPSSTGGSGITGYKLGWKSNDQDYDSSRQESVSVHVTRYCIEGLTNEVEYSVRVIAVNKVGDSTPSAEETATPTDAGICERTPAVRSQILKHVRWVHGEVECADVTDAHLAAVKTYPMVFTARPDDRHTSDYIPLFKPGDFDGLSNLGHLIIRGSDSLDGSFSELPEGLFDDLTGLRRLEMSRLGGLTTLPDGIFDNLTGLADLEFTYNDGLSELPGGAFEGLSNLRELHLRSNKGLTQLPDDAFDNLTNLRYLDLDYNPLTELPDGLFDDLTTLEELSMIGNQFTELPDGLFDNLTSLEKLYVAKTQLTELPDGLFDNLTTLEGLSIGGQFTVLPDGLFDNLTTLEGLSIGGQFTVLPDGLFDNLTNLERLGVHGQLTALPDGLFDNLTNLAEVFLDRNPGAPFVFGLEIARNKDNVVVNVSNASPFDILSTLEAAGGSLSTTEVTLPAGSTSSDVINVTPDGDGSVAVRLVSAEFDALRAQGIAVGRGAPLILPNAQSDNHLAAGSPTISGTAQVGQTLTASASAIADQDGLTNVSYAYQWVTNDGTTDRDIAEATASTYTIGTSDLGQRIKVMVTFADDGENHEIVTSGATEPAETAPNVPATGKPVIVGDPIIPWDAPWSWRSTLSVDLSGVSDKNGMSGSDFSFTWRCVKEDGDYYCGIGYSSKPTFPIIRMFRGETIKVYVSFMDDGGNVETLESEPIGPVTYAPSPAEGAPVIGGIPRVGSWLLGGSHGIYDRNGITIHRSSFSYQWIVDNTDVDGETGHNYTVKSTDVGKTIKMRLSFTDDDGFAESLVSAPTAPVVAADSANSPATGAPLIRGSFRVGNTLRAITDYSSYIRDADGLIAPNFAYQWIRSNGNTDTDIEDATESTYELTDDDVGKAIKVQVFFNDDPGNQEALISALSATVVPVATDSANHPAQGTAAIVGTAQVGETLTVNTSGISDQDGMENATYSFTWRANDIEGDGGLLRGGGLATTYMVQPGDAGKTLTAHWYFVDDQGNQESGTLETTTVLATVPDPPENLRVTPSETGELDIQWDAPWWDLDSLQDSGAVGDGGSPITSYTVQWKKAGGSWDAPQDVSEATATDTSHNIATGLELEVEYTVRVFATNAVGNGAASDEVAATAVAQFSQHQAGTQNNPAGLPTITGTPLAGGTLTADTSSITDPDGLTTSVYRYQWLMTDADGDTVIEGATASTYTLPDDYAGVPIKVKVSFTDDAGNEEVLTSNGVAGMIVTIANNSATGAPTISGNPQVGQTLTADTSPIDDEDGLTNATFEYQWTAGGSDIDGATGSSYLLTSSEQGLTIQVRVTFTDDRNNAETLTSEATVEVTAVPVPLTASFLAAPSSHDGDNSFTFELRLSEEVDLSYVTLRDHDAFSVTDGEVTGVSRLDKPGNLRWQIVVEPDSDADVTLVLPPTTDCGAQGAICTGGGKKLSGRVELTVNGPEQQNQERQNNSATGAPAISGTPQVEETLTADTANIADQDGLTGVSYRYQWIAGGADISGATGASHTLTAAEEGQTIQVRVDFTDDAGNDETLTSVATVAVAPKPNSEPTGLPAITGTPQVGETLTADVSGIDDADGLTNVSYRYQWLAGGSDIEDATGSSHLLTASQQGQTVHVKVTFTDDADNQESLTSAETLAVAAKPNTAAAGEPTISGTPQVEQTLTADTSGISDANGLNNVSYQYQWLRDDADIAGQTNSTYRLVSADEGKTIKVRVTFRDDADNAESLTSMATTAVAAQPVETPAVLLTASFANVPADHNGSSFTFQLSFSENVEAGYARIRDHAFTVTGATIDSASRITQGSNQGWNVEVNPTGNEAITITLPETTNCSDDEAICTDDERMLSHSTEERVEGPPAISVSDATVQEAEGATLEFSVTLSHASSRTVTVSYATQDGTATAGPDYTATSATLTFNAGDLSQTVEVTVLTDSEDEGQETLTLTLSNPSQATLGDGTGTGTIENGESSSGTQEDPPAETPAVLLTASFGNMPATHNGSEFTFDLAFSEDFPLSYVTLRDDAFTVDGGNVENAQRKVPGSNQTWTITVKPLGAGTISITLPETTDCNATGAICTDDDRKLSHTNVATITGPG